MQAMLNNQSACSTVAKTLEANRGYLSMAQGVATNVPPGSACAGGISGTFAKYKLAIFAGSTFNPDAYDSSKKAVEFCACNVTGFPSSPNGLSYTFSTGSTVAVGSALSIIPTTHTTSTGNKCILEGDTPLPAGLTLNATTCAISGVPLAAQPATTYWIHDTDPKYAGTSYESIVGLGVTNAAPVVITVWASTPPAPPAPINLSRPSVTTTSMTFTWSSGGGTTAGYRYNIAQGQNATVTCQNGKDIGNTTSITLANLFPDFTYKIAVCSYEAAAGILSSPTILVRATVPELGPVSIFNTTATSLTARWNSGRPSVVKIATGHVTNLTCASGVETGSTQDYYTWNNLANATDYTIAVCVYNDVGEHLVSQSVLAYATTLLPVVKNISARAVNSSTVSVSWTSGGAPTAGYFASIVPFGARGGANCQYSYLTSIYTGTTASASFTGLANNTKYTVAVCPYIGSWDMNGRFSQVVTSVTLGTPPTVP